MKNRDSAHPGRIKLTPVDAANGIYDMVRADEPRDPGTPLNKKLLDYAVAACGVTAGTATAYTLDDEFGGFELVDGAKINFRPHVASEANPTLNVNGTGNKYITNRLGVPLLSSITTSAWITATYSKELDAYVTAIPNAEYRGNLGTLSWESIDTLSKSGRASSIFLVGDEKNIVVNGETLTLVIVGFNHDTLENGEKAGITFGLKNLMSAKRSMNSAATISGGFTGSAMYTWLTDTLWEALPSDMKHVIKSVRKMTSIGDHSTTINANMMKLFLFSEIEVHGTINHSVPGEGSQYSYFAVNNNRIKYLANGSGDANGWWERSPISDKYPNAFAFCITFFNGTSGSDAANNSQGVCFGFCI